MEKIVGVGCRFRLAPRVKISGFKPGSGTRGNLQGIFLLNQATFLRFALF